MNELTYKNHCKFGYNGEYFNFRKTPEDQFHVTYGKCEREPYNFKKECIETAKLIYQKTDLPIYVLFSGGIDSEIVVNVFMEAGIPFTPVTVVFDDYINEHDAKYAFSFCEKHNLNHKILNLNILSFWENEMMYYADMTKANSPQINVMMWAMDMLNGYTVFCDGTSNYIKDNFINREINFCWNRFMMLTKKEGVPTFFTYTPELMLSFLNDIEEKTLNTPYYNFSKDGSSHCSYHKIRNEVYKLYWNWEERKIYNGFEKIMNTDEKYREILMKKYPGGNSYFPIPIDKLREILESK